MSKRISDFNIQLYNSWCEAKSELSLAEYSYQKGRADAIEECIELIEHECFISGTAAKCLRRHMEQLKEQK